MPGLLDVFTIGFESDTLKEFEANLKRNEKELDVYEKKVKEAEEALKKLKEEGKEDSVEFKKWQKTLEESKNKVETFKTSVETMKKSAEHSLLQVKNNFLALGKTVARLAIVGATIKKSLDFYEQGEQLQFLAQKASVATDKLQTLGIAARRYGGSTEGVAGTVENLRNQYQSLRMGQGGGGLEQAAFKYGVGISSDPEKMLENVARRMETLKSDAAKWDLANTLGIDEGTARLLMQGTKAYTEELKRAQKYKLYTKEDLERMRQYRQISLDIRMGIDSIFASIARMLLPAITAVSKIIRGVIDWFVEHQGAVQLITILGGITLGVIGLKNAFGLLTPAVKLFGVALSGIQLLGWGLIITGVIAVLEDLYTFIQGGDSLIGDLWESWGYDLDQIRIGFRRFIDDTKAMWNNFLAIFDKSREHKMTTAEQLEQKSLKELTPEQLNKYNKWKLNQENAKLKESLNGKELSMTSGSTNPFTRLHEWGSTQIALMKGKRTLNNANNNRFNSVPAGAQSVHYQTESQNSTSINNSRNIANTSSKTTNIQTVNVNMNTNSPRDFIDNLSAAAELDNGIMAGY